VPQQAFRLLRICRKNPSLTMSPSPPSKEAPASVDDFVWYNSASDDDPITPAAANAPQPSSMDSGAVALVPVSRCVSLIYLLGLILDSATSSCSSSSARFHWQRKSQKPFPSARTSLSWTFQLENSSRTRSRSHYCSRTSRQCPSIASAHHSNLSCTRKAEGFLSLSLPTPHVTAQASRVPPFL
jgi:hypothetical protein